MRSLLSKITAVAAVAFMMLGFLAVPSAEAQTYPPTFPGAVDCDSLPAPSIAIVGTDIVVTFAQGSLTCIIRVVIQVNPVVYDGPPPVSGVLTVPLPVLDGDTGHVATVTATYSIGLEKSDSVAIPAAAMASARAAAAAAGVVVSVPANTVAGAAGAAGTSVPAAPQNLAFTGSAVNLPLAAGALLVGAGGLTLLAARKREQSA